MILQVLRTKKPGKTQHWIRPSHSRSLSSTINIFLNPENWCESIPGAVKPRGVQAFKCISCGWVCYLLPTLTGHQIWTKYFCLTTKIFQVSLAVLSTSIMDTWAWCPCLTGGRYCLCNHGCSRYPPHVYFNKLPDTSPAHIYHSDN